MKNFLIYIIVSSALSITGGMIYAKYYLSPRVKEIVERKASEALGVPVQIHDLRVLILPQLSLAATGIKFALKEPNLKVEISKVFINAPLNASLFSKTSTFGPIKIRMESPRVSLELKSPDVENPKDLESNVTTAIRLNYSRDLSIELSVEQAKFKITQLSSKGEIENETNLEPLDIEMNIPGIEKAWKANLRMNLAMSHPQLSIPVEIQSEFLYKSQILSLSRAAGNVAGIPFILSGEQKFLEKIGNWKITVDMPEISKNKAQPKLPFLKNLSGGIHSEIAAVLALGQSWQFFGSVVTHALTGDINWSHDDFKVNGPFKIDCDSKFSFFKNLKIEHLLLHAKLDQLELSKAGLLDKPKDTKLAIDMNLSGRNQVLNILDFTFSFANMKVYANGSIALLKDQSSEINFHVDPLSLSGWEKYLVLFSSAPLAGQFSTDTSLHGDLFKDWYLDFHPLRFEKVKSTIHYVSEEKNIQIAGTFEMDTSVRGAYDFSKEFAVNSLSLEGSASIHLSDFEYIRDEAKMKSQSEVSFSQIAEMPHVKEKWAGIKTSKFEIGTEIGRFRFENFMANKITGTVKASNQVLTANFKLSEFSSGEAEMKNLILDYRKPNPEFTGLVSFKKIEVAPLLNGLFPDSDGMLSGDASGQISFALPISYQGDALPQIRTNGQIEMTNALIGSRQLDDILNEKLAQIPGLGRASLPAAPHTGSEMNLIFAMSDLNLNVQSFKLLTPAKAELQAKGSVLLKNQNLNLTGTAFLANAPIGGDVRAANSDAQGRFIIPFAMQGTLKHPLPVFAEKSIEEILRKTMYFVAKRETDKIKRLLTGGTNDTPPEAAKPVSKATGKAIGKATSKAAQVTTSDDVEEQETPEPSATPRAAEKSEPKPAQNKVEAFKNRLQGLFDKH